MFDLGPSPRGSTTPRPGPTLFSGIHCAECRLRANCAAANTVEACGDPCEYPLAIHPRTTPLDALEPTGLSPFKTALAPPFGDVLLVANRVHGRAVMGVRLLNSLSALTRRPSAKPRHTGGVSVLLGHDLRIDRAWAHNGRLGRALAADGFSCVISPGYSTWRTDSPFASRVAMLQSAYIATVLGRHLPTVPTIVWRYWADLDQWSEWIGIHGVRTIAIDNGSLRDDGEWQASLQAVNYLGMALREGHRRWLPRLLISGPSTLDRIAAVAQEWPGPLTIVSQQPWLLAVHRTALGSDLQEEPAARTEIFADLLAENATNFDWAVGAVLKKARGVSSEMPA